MFQRLRLHLRNPETSSVLAERYEAVWPELPL